MSRRLAHSRHIRAYAGEQTDEHGKSIVVQKEGRGNDHLVYTHDGSRPNTCSFQLTGLRPRLKKYGGTSIL